MKKTTASKLPPRARSPPRDPRPPPKSPSKGSNVSKGPVTSPKETSTLPRALASAPTAGASTSSAPPRAPPGGLSASRVAPAKAPASRASPSSAPPPRAPPAATPPSETASTSKAIRTPVAKHRTAASPRQDANESPAPRAWAHAPSEDSFASLESFRDSPRTPAASDSPDLRLIVRRRTKPAPTMTMPMETDSSAPGPARRPRSPDSAEKGTKRPKTLYSDAAAASSPASQADAAPAASGAATATPAACQGKKRYPPIIVEELPHFAQHLRELKAQLGRPPNVRPYGKGLRFLPLDADEYRLLQRYFIALASQEGIAWHSYSPPSDRGVKVAIRGLPVNATPEEIADELRELGFDPEYIRAIRGRGGRPGCIFLAVLKKTRGVIPDIYEVKELLGMPEVHFEAWRGKRKPAQCHRCQQFRHSSHHCHRAQACVRCGGEHAARDCPRPREQPATCANCKGEHPANHFRCPVFRREARNKKAGTAAVTGGPHRPAPVNPQPLGERQGASLMAEANAPSTRGANPATSSAAGRRRRRRGKRSRKTPATEEEAAAPAAPTSQDAPPAPPQPALQLVETANQACQTDPTPRKAKRTQTATAADAPATSPSAILAAAQALIAELTLADFEDDDLAASILNCINVTMESLAERLPDARP